VVNSKMRFRSRVQIVERQTIMKHYHAKDWIDFTRGTLAPEQKSEMQEHLDGGCVPCKQEMNLWTWMKDFGSHESANEPPAAVVNIVKAAITGQPKKARNLMREIAELVFDSFSQPQVAGVRSTSAAPRQLLYRAGAVMIDMRLENTTDSDRFALTGQLLTAGEKKHALRQVPVHLLSGINELASTSTNQFGEFFFEHEIGKDLQVSLEVSNERNVFIPLDESIWRVTYGQ
jgi:hypothetical protein